MTEYTPNEHLSEEQNRKLEKFAQLVDPLCDVRYDIDVKDLTPLQNNYWRWWVVEKQVEFGRSYEEDDEPASILEIAEMFGIYCRAELEIIRTASDAGLEMRRLRLASEFQKEAQQAAERAGDAWLSEKVDEIAQSLTPHVAEALRAAVRRA